MWWCDKNLNNSLFYTCSHCSATIPSHHLNSHTQHSPSCSTYHFQNQDLFTTLKSNLKQLNSYSSFLNFPKKIKFPFNPPNDLKISQIEELENFILVFQNRLTTILSKNFLISDILEKFSNHTRTIQTNQRSLEILSKKTGLLINNYIDFTIIAAEGPYWVGRNSNNNQVIIYNNQENTVKSILYNTDKKFNSFAIVPKFNYFVYLVQSFICFWDHCKNIQCCCIPRDTELVDDYFFHSKYEQKLIYFSFSAVSVWDVAKLEKTQKFLLDFRVKKVCLSKLFKKSVYYSCYTHGEIWKIDCLNGKNELILGKNMVDTIVPISKNDDLIVVFIRNPVSIYEVLVYNTVSRTLVYTIKLSGTYSNPDIRMLIHNPKLLNIGTLLNNFETYSLDYTQATIPKQQISLKSKKTELDSIRKNISVKISEFYLDRPKQTLFAICSKSKSKFLLIHNLLSNSNTFYSVSSSITSLSLSVSNYIIFNSQHFFIYWNLSKAEIGSVLCIGKGSLNGQDKVNIEFSLRKFYDEWIVYKQKYLVYSMKNFTKIGVLRLNRQEMESIGKFECTPLCLKRNKILGVYKGEVSLLRSNGIREKCGEVQEKNQKCLFCAFSNENLLVFGYRDRCFVINILNNEVCGDIGYGFIDKVISVKSYPNIGLIIVHEVNQILIFTNCNPINLFTVNYKFSKKGLSIRVTENNLHLLLINKKLMIILNLKNGQQEEIKYSSNRAFAENIIFINSTYFVLFVNADKFVYNQINTQCAEIYFNTKKFHIFIGNIINTSEKAYFSFEEEPKIEIVNEKFLVLHEPDNSYFVYLNESIHFIIPSFTLLNYIENNKLPGSDFWDILVQFIKSNSKTEDFSNRLELLTLPQKKDKIVLKSGDSELFLINVSNLSIDTIKLPILRYNSKILFYSSSIHKLLIIEGNQIETLSLSDLTITTTASESLRYKLVNFHYGSPDYAIIDVYDDDKLFDNLIISLSSFTLLNHEINLEISGILIFSLPDSLLFSPKDDEITMKTFSISKEHEVITTLKTYFEYYAVFLRSTYKDGKYKTVELKIFCDLNKEFMVLVHDGKVLIVKIKNLEVLASLGSSFVKEFTCVEFSECGKFIGFGNDQGMVYCWNCKAGGLRNFFCHMNPVVFIGFNCEDELILSYAEGEERLMINSIK